MPDDESVVCDIHMDPERLIVYSDRGERDSCEAGTMGCCVNHTDSALSVSCECW